MYLCRYEKELSDEDSQLCQCDDNTSTLCCWKSFRNMVCYTKRRSVYEHNWLVGPVRPYWHPLVSFCGVVVEVLL